MRNAEASGYAGVSFVVHRITKHVTAVWTGPAVDDKLKSFTENILYIANLLQDSLEKVIVRLHHTNDLPYIINVLKYSSHNKCI